MQDWFIDAKFGIFIHWGIYSTGRTSESWAFFSGQVPCDEYMKQSAEFTASAYDPEAWAELFHAAGAKYVVLTANAAMVRVCGVLRAGANPDAGAAGAIGRKTKSAAPVIS